MLEILELKQAEGFNESKSKQAEGFDSLNSSEQAKEFDESVKSKKHKKDNSSSESKFATIFLMLIPQIVLGLFITLINELVSKKSIDPAAYNIILITNYAAAYCMFILILIFKKLITRYPLNYILFFLINLVDDFSKNYLIDKFISKHSTSNNDSYIVIVIIITYLILIAMLFSADIMPKLTAYHKIIKIVLIMLFILDFGKTIICEYSLENKIICWTGDIIIGLVGIITIIFYMIANLQIVTFSNYTYKKCLVASFTSYLGLSYIFKFALILDLLNIKLFI